MKKTLAVLAFVALVSTNAFATSILNYDNNGTAVAGSKLAVDTVITPSGANYQWTYTVTPESGATNIQSFTVHIGAAGLSSLVGAPSTPTVGFWNTNGWTVAIDPANGVVQWNSVTASELTASNTGTFWLVSKMPFGNQLADASAQADGTYSGRVPAPAPAVPEPMSILLGTVGLGALSGLRKLRSK